MRVDRGAGWVTRPVKPVGAPGSIEPRTAARRRSAGLIVAVQLGIVVVVYLRMRDARQ